jgi:beta-glucosidase
MVNGVTSGVAANVPGAAGNTRPIERLGIPSTVLADGPAGLRIQPTRQGDTHTYYCTGFPVGTLLASSWDLSLVEDVTKAMGNEVLEYGVDVLLAPGMNIHRNPLCGRNFEYFSEDPLLSGKMAAAYVKGIQSNGVGTSIKHYAANNQETNRNEDDAIISQRALREIYLKNFEIAVKEAQPWTVMSSYNKLNGDYTQQSEGLLTTVLRDEWGFKGIVMTDWGNKAGTVKSAKAGNDLMEPGNQNEIDRIIAGVQDGTISQEELDRNVRNMLTYIVRTPRFKGYEYTNKPDLKAHAEVARKAAGESIVLLRNENALPLAGSEKVALYGISAIDFVAGGTGSGDVNKAYVVNMEEAMDKAGFTLDKTLSDYYKAYVAYDKAQNSLSGTTFSWFSRRKLAEIAIPAAAIANEAKANDVAVVVLGRNAGEGADRKQIDDFELTTVERELLRDVSTAYHAAGKKVVVVLNVGGVIETTSWKNMVDAIVLPWSPGQEGANAVADVLTGKVNPSGKLPMTFPVNFMDHPSSANFPYNYQQSASRGFSWGPRQPQKDVDYTNYEEGIWVGYRHFVTRDVEVSYPFGFGLSYTSFAYSKPVVKAGKDGFTATVTVKNTGKVAGKEVVELYVSAPAGGLDKPARELKAFGKTRELQPGESQTLTLQVSAYELASFNEASSAWEAAAGKYNVQFGASVDDIRCAAPFTLKKAQSWPVHNVLAPAAK